MADLSITAADVSSTGFNSKYLAGEAITQGQTVYRNGRTWMLADASAVDTAATGGIAVNSALVGQPLAVCTAGNINPGATMTVGTSYYQSATAGGICPESDLVAGNFATFLGFATTTTNLSLAIQPSGVAKP